MRIRSVSLKQFRNHRFFSWVFPSEGSTLFFGPNGSGKTSVLEAINVLVMGHSFRERDRRNRTERDTEHFLIEGVLSYTGGESRVSFYQDASGASEWLKDGKKTNIRDMACLGHVMSYQSGQLQQLIDSPALLRKWFNQALFGLENVYLETLVTYNKALKSKGSLLRGLGSELEIRGWNRILADHAEILVNMRQSFSDSLQQYLQESSSGTLSISYRPDSREFFTKEKGFSHLEKMGLRERTRGITLTGPHRDRWVLLCEGRPLQFCSSGERKKAFIQLSSSYLSCFIEKRRDYPVYMADDFDTALDDRRVEEHMDLFPQVQFMASSVGKRNGFSSCCELQSSE